MTVVCGASMAARVRARRNCTMLCCTQNIMARSCTQNTLIQPRSALLSCMQSIYNGSSGGAGGGRRGFGAQTRVHYAPATAAAVHRARPEAWRNVREETRRRGVLSKHTETIWTEHASISKSDLMWSKLYCIHLIKSDTMVRQSHSFLLMKSTQTVHCC